MSADKAIVADRERPVSLAIEHIGSPWSPIIVGFAEIATGRWDDFFRDLEMFGRRVTWRLYAPNHIEPYRALHGLGDWSRRAA